MVLNAHTTVWGCTRRALWTYLVGGKDVQEGKDVLVLVDLVARDGALDDFLEDSLGHGVSSSLERNEQIETGFFLHLTRTNTQGRPSSSLAPVKALLASLPTLHHGLSYIEDIEFRTLSE